MEDFEHLRHCLKAYRSVEGGKDFFRNLGYHVMDPVEYDLEEMSARVHGLVASVKQLVHVRSEDGGSPFRVFHVFLRGSAIRRSSMRSFLENFYRRYPSGENLFVFSPENHFEELAFVSPRRFLDPRDSGRVRLALRVLQVERERPCRTDLEILNHIQVNGTQSGERIWQLHEEAFSVERVTERFFRDYRSIFSEIRKYLEETHGENGPEWARDYTHQLLNRIMFIYFVARKKWLLGRDAEPDRDFMLHFFEAYRETESENAFHTDWLNVLFFEAFNNQWQNHAEYMKRFPGWLIRALSQAPFLNGGLYGRRWELDGRLREPLPDAFFEFLFTRWMDGTTPGLFERYNFTVVESGRFDEEVAVDPEMLGMVYERLVNVTFTEGGEEDLRGQAGIFYTPRTEIDLMCRLALLDWLENHMERGHRELLCRWVFAFSEEEKEEVDREVTRENLWEKLYDLVRRIRVCDPACGSGSFLVGMMLVLDELLVRCNRILGRAETPYERRKRIMQDQLYGVDVMEWAVRVAELRLWLQLVVETELHSAELHFKPLLPNLNLKFRPGDSLLQTLGDLDLSFFRRDELSIPSHLKGRLTQLKGKKRRFFQGEEPGLTEELLRKEERGLFRDILDHRIRELQNTLVQKQSQLRGLSAQSTLPGMPQSPTSAGERERLNAEIRELEEQYERYQKARDAFRSNQPPPFVWDMAFVEIFEDEDPGFDIVVGNPPYVRQEQVRDYLGRFERTEYLNRLNESLRAIYPGFMGRTRRISGRADYYLYFYLHALSLLSRKGAFCFITSNSWLDVDFGKDLQEFFLRFGHLKMVIDNRAKRSFAQADVNTVIVLAGPPERRRPLSEAEMKRRPVRFVAFRVPFEEAMSPVVFSEIEDESLYESLAGFRVLRRPEFRALLHDQWALYQEGLAEPEEDQSDAETSRPTRRRGGAARALSGMDLRPYAGNKWGGKYLRAPDIFFTILEKGRVGATGRSPLLVRLGDIAEVRFGIKTGANEFFYLEPVGRTVKEVAELREKDPGAPVRVKNGAGWEGEIEAAWLRPVIKSLREIKTLRVRLEDLHYLVFMSSQDVRAAINQGQQLPLSQYLKAAAYIRWGERQGYHLRPTCASRPWWWDVGEHPIPPVIYSRRLGDRHLCPINGHALVADTLYELSANNSTETAIFISSTLGRLLVEREGRELTGAITVVELYIPDLLRALVPNPVVLTPRRKQLERVLERMGSREVHSIFEELGFSLCQARKCDHPEHPYEHVRPEALTLEGVRQASPDRFELDRVVFDVLELTDEERLEVYRAVAQLVKDRLVKARSV